MPGSSASHSVRLDSSDHDKLTEMSRAMGQPKSKVLHRALNDLHRNLILEATNNAYADLKRDKTAWAEELAERRLLDGSLGDGLGD